ncbi:hypothetical protein AEGHOMDF_3288 [Methylobacterium soli]|nr:hypothetical protein AEGHOMDF_3288 [Methylobacterium soli]
MDGVLVKPFTLADLARMLAATLPDHAGARAPVPDGAPEEAPAAGATDVRLLDPDTLASLSEIAAQSGTPFIERLLRLFRDHGPTALDALEAATEAGDAPAVASAAHGLKSMSVNVGAQALGHALARIERQARLDGICPEAGLLAGLRPLLADTQAALQSHFRVMRAA